ncbi:tail completion protein gp17 [Paenibacillus paeoniae]|uniref:DUF3168 domain-containing protein n=1 Tax=Paenibacillus paeoniae TaxID=2292705 RepID=A0A371P0E6_9BACL|nr:DUF3168 domain-containing protein [Paenibacillus paeoniae]REK69341.1 DUF3168 domain-containing protein [Paenibacillus paeoniae]
MIDIKPVVNALLSSIPGVTVSDAFPTKDAKLPYISFYELVNQDPLTIASSPLSDISVQIDVWHNRSTGAIAAQVDSLLNSIGMRRKMANDIPDPSGLKRKTMRYRGVVDKRTGRISQ